MLLGRVANIALCAWIDPAAYIKYTLALLFFFALFIKSFGFPSLRNRFLFKRSLTLINVPQIYILLRYMNEYIQ